MITLQQQSWPVADPREALTSSEWSSILGITSRAFRLRRIEHTGMEVRNGGLVKVWAFSVLPADYQAGINERRIRHRALTAGELLSIRETMVRWEPDFEFCEKPEATQAKALKVKEVMRVYYSLLDANREKREANLEAQAQWLRLFAVPCNEKTIRRWEEKIDARGGFEFAPLEAYCDNSDAPRIKNRREHRLGIPRALIDTFRCLTTTTEHISGAYHKLATDWIIGRDVPGLGCRKADEPFPFTMAQLRPYAASTPARRMGSHGKARARREALPHISTSTANLRRAQMYMLDDTRIDIIATDDATGRPVELKSYWMIDVASRRIEGFICREAGAIKADDVDILVARVLRRGGLAAPGSGYATYIKFERGTVACTPAKKQFLEGAFPGQLVIGDTDMDGGKNHAADFLQHGSGHWMGKPYIESLMRTVAFFVEHLAGQRGGNYRRQPAQLALKGRDKETGLLEYHKGGSVHEAALLGYADRAMEYLKEGTVGDPNLRRLKVSALRPVSWIVDALKEFVAYYNSRTDHRMEGFDRIESQGKNGQLEWRMESPNERAARLEQLCPTQRLSEADMSFMLRMKARSVTVRSQRGVTLDMAPFKGLRFWKENSIACHEAARLTTCEKKYVALLDPEALLHWTPESQYRREIYLMADAPAGWKEGDEVPARFLEALPLYEIGNRADPETLAERTAERKREEKKFAGELVRATTPRLAERMAEAESNVTKMRGVIHGLNLTTSITAAMPPTESALIREIENATPEAGPAPKTTRVSQQDSAAEALRKFQEQYGE